MTFLEVLDRLWDMISPFGDWTTLYSLMTVAVIGLAMWSDSRVATKLGLCMGINFMTTLFGIYIPILHPFLKPYGEPFIAAADGLLGLFIFYRVAAFYRSKQARLVATIFIPIEAWHWFAFSAQIQHTFLSYAVLNAFYVVQLIIIAKEAVGHARADRRFARHGGVHRPVVPSR